MMWLYLKFQRLPYGAGDHNLHPLVATTREEAEKEIAEYLHTYGRPYDYTEVRLITGESRDMTPVYETVKRGFKEEVRASKRAQLEQLKRELGEE